MVLVCDLNKFRALCTCGTRLTSARRLPRPWIWVLGRDTIICIYVKWSLHTSKDELL
ncbi:hypothetical protein SLEP1_g22790 [Rubroshorea leprosula]|uniref:Uncharacterized protein n=1 Tax=Rubroshorea leprosula TaxID=152421 RepID=A0AAV5JFL9_9ROSI|nr:hypothetical protein SLEP1_g22790 [Rubroshorea leprosula]